MTGGFGRLAGIASAIALSAIASGAAAEELAGADADALEKDIVVTAQGRPQDRRDVPITLSSFDQEALRTLGVNSLRDLSAFTPGLIVETQYPTTPYIVIRGISTNTPDPTSEPRISVFVDGVSASRPQAALSELFDISRIEVIKGPQSTLFGRSALTGAISIVQNKADPDAMAAQLRGTIGNLGERRLEGMVNIPLTDQVAFRVAGVVRNTDGYVGNLAGGDDLNGDRLGAMRGAFHAETAGGVTIDLIGNYQHDRFTGLSYKSGLFYPSNPATGARLGDLSPETPTYLTVGGGFPTGGLGGERDMGGVTLLWSAPLSDTLSLSGTGAWSKFRARFAGDFDGTSLSILTTGEDGRSRQWAGDIRLSWTPSPRLRVMLGGSVADEKGSQYFPLTINERAVLALQTGVLNRANPTLQAEAFYNNPQVVAGQLLGALGQLGVTIPQQQALAIANNISTARREDLTRTSQATYYDLFGDVTLQATDRLELQAGLRWSFIDKRSGISTALENRSILGGFFAALSQPAAIRTGFLQALAAPGAGTIPQSTAFPLPVFGLLSQPTATAAGDTATLKDNGPSWRLSARYALSPTANLYASYARGRRPGVLAPQAPSAPGGPARFATLAAETVDSVEAGLKLRTADRRVELDTAVFAYRYEHFQTQIVQGTALVTLDAGKARSYGLEATGTVRPIDGLTLFATYAYSHTRFATGLYDGNHVRLSPDHAASAGLTVELPAPGGSFAMTPTVDWRSRLYFDDSNGNPALQAGGFVKLLPYQASQAPYARGNLRIAYTPDEAPLRIEAFVANITNTRYIRDIGQGSLSFGLPSYVAAPPRTYGLTLTISQGSAR